MSLKLNALRLPMFTLLSGIGWCIDFIIFNNLVAHGYSYFLSNLISATVAVSFVLVTARRWVFQNHTGTIVGVVAQYVIWNIVAITVSSFAIALIATGLERFDYSLFDRLYYAVMHVQVRKDFIVSNLAKISFTPVTMYANFVAAGYIIERRFSFY